MDECNPSLSTSTRWTSPQIRFVPSWTRSPTSGTCLWLPMWIMGSPLWPTPWCPRLGSFLHPEPERPASQTHAKTSRSAASPSNQRMWFREVRKHLCILVLPFTGGENCVNVFTTVSELPSLNLIKSRFRFDCSKCTCTGIDSYIKSYLLKSFQ